MTPSTTGAAGPGRRGRRSHGGGDDFSELDEVPGVFGSCEECGAAITRKEDAQLNLDIDFIEHKGHLIRRAPMSRRQLQHRSDGGEMPNDTPLR